MSLRIIKSVGYCTARDCSIQGPREHTQKSAGAKLIKRITAKLMRQLLKREVQQQLDELLEGAITEEYEKNLIDEEWTLFDQECEEEALIDKLEKERLVIVEKLRKWKAKVAKKGLISIDNDGGLPYGVYRPMNQVA
jgi:hypothetical protein